MPVKTAYHDQILLSNHLTISQIADTTLNLLNPSLPLQPPPVPEILKFPLALALLRNGQFSDAFTVFSLINEQNITISQQIDFMNAVFHSKMFKEADTLLCKILSYDPALMHIPDLLTMACITGQLGLVRESQKYLSLVNHDKCKPRDALRMACFCLRADMTRRAIELFESFPDSTRDLPAEFLPYKALAYLVTHDPDKAAHITQEDIRISGSRFNNILCTSLILSTRGLFQQAVEILEGQLEINSNETEKAYLHHCSAMAYRALHNLDKAIEHHEAAIAKQPDIPSAWLFYFEYARLLRYTNRLAKAHLIAQQGSRIRYSRDNLCPVFESILTVSRQPDLSASIDTSQWQMRANASKCTPWFPSRAIADVWLAVASGKKPLIMPSEISNNFEKELIASEINILSPAQDQSKEQAIQ